MEERLAAADVPNAAAEARWLCEEASGFSGAEWMEVAPTAPVARAEAHLERMVRRRIEGEPLQYVLGSWSFRGLDLMVDPRVLIPRPETEWVVEIAVREAEALGVARRRRPTRRNLVPIEATHLLADLGTGSGAIALALAAELADAEVWATDVSADALAVARANAAGNGALRVQTVEGSWFGALPLDLAGRFTMIVSNPPYVADHERELLPDVVRAHEPTGALFSGPTGLEAYALIIPEAPRWLTRPGALVLEMAPHQGDALRSLALGAGFRTVDVLDDLTARARVLVARLD